MSPTVINYVEEYFHTLNPLAKRIVEEINHTRDAYESLWDNLTEPEQRQIVDEAIIRPEAVLQYSRIQTGAKYVVYEDGTSGKGIKWRDEHSAPFSWLTRSQQDLRIFGSSDPLPTPTHKKMSKSSTPVRRSKPPAPPAPELHMDPPSLVLGGSSAKLITTNSSPSKQNILNKLISKTAVFKLPFAGKSVAASEARDATETQSLLTGDGVTCAKIVKPVVLKPKSPPPPPPPAKQQTPVKKVPPPPPKKPAKKPSVVHQAMQVRMEYTADEEDDVDKKKVEKKERGGFSEGETPLLSESMTRSDSSDAASAIPKTGFEFLDNW